MGLLAGAEIGESRAGFDDAGESGPGGAERELSHGGECEESLDGEAAASQVGDDGVPVGNICTVYVLVEPSSEIVWIVVIIVG